MTVTEHKIAFGRSTPPHPVAGPTRIAQLLALAIRFERLLREGKTTQVEIARRYGVSRARVTQVLNLASLAPGIQEEILFGNVDVAEREIRGMTLEARWSEHQNQLSSSSHLLPSE